MRNKGASASRMFLHPRRVAYCVRFVFATHRAISPVVYTCGVSVLQDLRRTKAVLGGLQSVESTQNHGSEKAGVGGSTPVT
jgi:hypothetical protein